MLPKVLLIFHLVCAIYYSIHQLTLPYYERENEDSGIKWSCNYTHLSIHSTLKLVEGNYSLKEIKIQKTLYQCN